MKMRTSRFVLYSMLFTGIVLVAGQKIAIADEGWRKGSLIIRAGAASVQPDDSSSTVGGIPDSGVSVKSNTQLGLTGSYFLSDNLAIGLLASTPFSHDISGTGSLAGLGKVANAKQLPPTLTLQYHFTGSSRAKPYIGAGLNYTLFFDESATASLEGALGGPTDVSLDGSFGFAVEAGADIALANEWYLNLSVWYIDIDTTADVTTGGTTLSVDVDIDPLVWMLGVGKRF